MAVPAHDDRDFEFAKKFKIPVICILSPDVSDEKQKRRTRAKSDEGRSEKLCDSDPFGDCEGAGNQRKAENGF